MSLTSANNSPTEFEKEKHTDLPWRNMETGRPDMIGLVILGPDGVGVAGAWSDSRPEAQANAAFIVKSANYHYQLVYQLKKAIHQLRMRKDKTISDKGTIATAEKLLVELES